ARFPSLRRLVIHEAAFSKEDWGHLFASLRSMPHLEELEIGGPALDDRAIAPLEGCRIKRLVIFQGGLAEFSPAIFAKMPDLKELTILSLAIGTSDVDPPIEETQRLIREALPGVKVVLVYA